MEMTRTEISPEHNPPDDPRLLLSKPESNHLWFEALRCRFYHRGHEPGGVKWVILGKQQMLFHMKKPNVGFTLLTPVSIRGPHFLSANGFLLNLRGNPNGSD